MKTIIYSLILACLAYQPAFGQASKESAALDGANASFNIGAVQLAASQYQDFLREYPSSASLAEVRYKMFVISSLKLDIANMQKYSDQLIEQHFDSPWACHILMTHCDANRLLAIANQKRKVVDVSKQKPEWERAVRVLQIFMGRFANDKQHQPEVIYKMGDCMRRLGRPEAIPVLKQVVAIDAEGDWGKLARFWLEDAGYFQKNMDSLAFMQIADNENHLAYLDLVDLHGKNLTPAERAKCLCLQASCLMSLDRKSAAKALWEKVLKEEAASPYAGESAFWLAELAFQESDFVRAREQFRQFAEQFPKHPRAEQARAFEQGLAELDASWQELGQVLQVMYRHCVGKPEPTMSMQLSLSTGNPVKVLNGRFAYQDVQHMLAQLTWAGGGVVVANNDQGGWFGIYERGLFIQAKQKIDVPLPAFTIDRGPDGKFNFFGNFGANRAPGTPMLTINPQVLTEIVIQAKHRVHLLRRPSKDTAGKVFVLQNPRFDTPAPTQGELMVDATLMPREFHCVVPSSKHAPSEWKLSEIRLGEPISAEAFTVPVPAGVQVRQTEQLQPAEIYPPLFELASRLMTMYSETRK